MNGGIGPVSSEDVMPHSVTPLPFKPPRLDGLSERLLASHYENNYGGALRRLNAIDKRLNELDWSTTPVFEVNGLKREELIAAGSVILHEIYFETRERPVIGRIACPWLIAPNDHEVLRHGFVIYDALYAWASKRKAETHSWPPAGMKAA